MKQPSPHPINDPEHWHARSEEAQTLADQMSDPTSKATMLQIARDYKVLAERAEQRTLKPRRNSN